MAERAAERRQSAEVDGRWANRRARQGDGSIEGRREKKNESRKRKADARKVSGRWAQAMAGSMGEAASHRQQQDEIRKEMREKRERQEQI